MAAPGNVYEGSLLNGSVPFAKKLLGYGSQIKELFYLDALIGSDRPGDPFIGLIIDDPTSTNYKFHNSARHFNARITFGGVNYIVLNDGGLNTAGKPTINSNLLQWANNIRNNYTFLSAFYVDTDFTGVRYRVGSGAWSEVSFGTTLPQNDTLTANKDFDSGLTKGTTIEMQGVLKNIEKPQYSPSVSIVLKSRISQFDVFKRSSPCTESGQTVEELWITDDTWEELPSVPESISAPTGIYFYKNIENTIKADAGWYYGLDTNKSYEVDSGGQVVRYELCTISRGDINLALEQDLEGNLSPVQASLTIPWLSSDIVISGRVDINSSTGTPSGKDFSVTILAGETFGQDTDFFLTPEEGVNYYWQNVGSDPSGFVINKSPIS